MDDEEDEAMVVDVESSQKKIVYLITDNFRVKLDTRVPAFSPTDSSRVVVVQGYNKFIVLDPYLRASRVH